MRYSLLNFIQCPVSRTELVCVCLKERPAELPHYTLSACNRVNQPGALVGPLPPLQNEGELTEVLKSESCSTAPDSRNYEVEVDEGFLLSAESGRWYPIRNSLPEILPDHLRDFQRDFEFLRAQAHVMPPRLFSQLNNEQVFGNGLPTRDTGIRYKLSEIHITDKITDPTFFGPGYLSPFNPHAQQHSAHLVKLFAFCLSTLQENGHRLVLDTGCGYAWTTEWLFRAGFEPIGVDITRIYMEVGLHRVGLHRPYLVVADTEHLPIRSGAADAVLGFDSFHHIPDRQRAMQEFDRVLSARGEVVLAEPGGGHEHDPGVKAVMDKYGILERGMELADVRTYVERTSFESPQQYHLVKMMQDELGAPLTQDFVAAHSWSVANFFIIRKGDGQRSE